jgi:hypothetical protein
VELYEQIRQEYEDGAGTIRAVARKLGVHRREVRKALASAMPAERKAPERERPKLAEAIPFFDAILEADGKAPRKRRHTAHRIWIRLRREKPEAEVAESTVRQYVRARKAAMGLLGNHGDPSRPPWRDGSLGSESPRKRCSRGWTPWSRTTRKSTAWVSPGWQMSSILGSVANGYRRFW